MSGGSGTGIALRDRSSHHHEVVLHAQSGLMASWLGTKQASSFSSMVFNQVFMSSFRTSPSNHMQYYAVH